ncbi:hypothetical protein V8F20_010139 [Naviculisporaceae sp. PSN 640]
MDSSNNTSYGHPSGGAPFYAPTQGQYPAPQGSYPTPIPPPPGPGQEGYYPQTGPPQQPSAPGYGQFGMPPAQPSYPAYGQQPGPGYQGQPHSQGHSSYGLTSPSPATFEPNVPQYAQQLSPPPAYGSHSPSPAPNYGYNPQNPPPLPPRSPAAQYSFAPPPVTAISSKPTGTLGRLGAKVAGTVQSKVKDYLAAKQGNIQSATLDPGTPGSTSTPITQPYGYSHSSQPWQGQTAGAQSYSVAAQSANEPPYTYQPPPNSYPQPYTYPHAPGHSSSSATSIPQSHSTQESAPAAPVGIYGPQPITDLPQAVTSSSSASSAPVPNVSSPASITTPAATPAPPATGTAPRPVPGSQSISAAAPAPLQGPQVQQTMCPELPESSQSGDAPASVTPPPAKMAQTTQPSQQSTQATTAPTESSMTWGWNLALNPASHPLGQAMPQVKLVPMFKSSANSEPPLTANTPDTPGALSPVPSVPPPSKAGHAPIPQIAPVPAQETPQMESPNPWPSSSRPVTISRSESDGFQPYRPHAAADSTGTDGLPGTEPPSTERIETSPLKPLSSRPVLGDPAPKPKPEVQKFQPYRAHGNDHVASLQGGSRPPEPPSNATTAKNADPWFSQTSVLSTSLDGTKPTSSTASSHTPPATQAHPASLSPGPRSAAQEHPPSLAPCPVPTQTPPAGQGNQQRPESAASPIIALGDAITNQLQNMSIIGSGAKINPPAHSVHSVYPLEDTAEPAVNIVLSRGRESREHSQPTGPLVTRRASHGPPYQDEYCPYPMLTSPMQPKVSSAAPKPHQSRLCFESNPVPFPRFYYRHPKALSFPICSWCFNTYIAPTHLASAFPESLGVTASGVVCGFHVPRITKLLWPAALRSGDLTDLVVFMEKRYPTLPTATAVPRDARNSQGAGDKAAPGTPGTGEVVLIKPCKPQGGTVFQFEDYRWYVSSDSLGLLVCEACYEDLILATPSFADKFAGPFTQAEVNQHTLSCHFSAFPYIKRSLLRYGGPVGDWEAFSRNATMRLEMSNASTPIRCDGSKITLWSSRWWTLKGDGGLISSLPLESDGSVYGRLQATDHFIMCEPCYMDAVAGSRFEEAFEMVAEAGSDAWGDMDQSTIYRWCTYSSGKNHAIQDAFSAAEMRKLSPQTLHSMLKEIAAKPRCGQVPMGIQDGLFYNFPAAEHVDHFGICEGHFVSTVKAWDLDHLFGESPRLVPGQAYCAFHPAIPRAEQWIHKLNEALDTGDGSIYKENVRKFAAIPLCPRRDAVANRSWYGWPDCLICPDCFEQFAAGTKLIKEMSWNNQHADYLAICSMYSPRQRELYRRACETGDVRELLAVSAERTKIWNRTVPRMTVLAAQKVIAEGEAMLASQLAHTHASSNAISFGDDGKRWTTSSGNTYQSYDGVLAEKYRNEADQLYAKIRGMDPTSERLHLMQLWESVE